MKTLAAALFISLCILQGCKSSKSLTGTGTQNTPPVQTTTVSPVQKTDFSDPSTWILGQFTVDRLYQSPYSEWFVTGFDNYSFSQPVIDKLKPLLTKAVTIKVVMGTWCPDSRREVPKFMRVLALVNFPLTAVEFIGVDNSKNAPVADYSSLDIQRVPTFIIIKNNIEAGRIIENPVTSLEQDMVNILSRNE